ncbi:MAG: hypothetical protein WC730_02375 [Patescibacteria group bacterium]|jgi:hypothetical protein
MVLNAPIHPQQVGGALTPKEIVERISAMDKDALTINRRRMIAAMVLIQLAPLLPAVSCDEVRKDIGTLITELGFWMEEGPLLTHGAEASRRLKYGVAKEYRVRRKPQPGAISLIETARAASLFFLPWQEDTSRGFAEEKKLLIHLVLAACDATDKRDDFAWAIPIHEVVQAVIGQSEL